MISSRREGETAGQVLEAGLGPIDFRPIDDLGNTHMTLTTGDERLATGTGANCLGHPAHAVVWLANALNQQNTPLRAGDVVLLHFTPHLAHDLQVALRAAHRAGLAPASLADYLPAS